MTWEPLGKMTREELEEQIEELREIVKCHADQVPQSDPGLNASVADRKTLSGDVAPPDARIGSDSDFNRAFRNARDTVPDDVDLGVGDTD